MEEYTRGEGESKRKMFEIIYVANVYNINIQNPLTIWHILNGVNDFKRMSSSILYMYILKSEECCRRSIIYDYNIDRFDQAVE